MTKKLFTLLDTNPDRTRYRGPCGAILNVPLIINNKPVQNTHKINVYLRYDETNQLKAELGDLEYVLDNQEMTVIRDHVGADPTKKGRIYQIDSVDVDHPKKLDDLKIYRPMHSEKPVFRDITQKAYQEILSSLSPHLKMKPEELYEQEIKFFSRMNEPVEIPNTQHSSMPENKELKTAYANLMNL